MPRYEVSVDGQNLLIHNPGSGTQKRLGFYATLLVEARNPEAAEAEALDRVMADPHVSAVAIAPPDLSIDAVSEIPVSNEGVDSMHGPIFCFFETPEKESKVAATLCEAPSSLGV